MYRETLYSQLSPPPCGGGSLSPPPSGGGSMASGLWTPTLSSILVLFEARLWLILQPLRLLLRSPSARPFHRLTSPFSLWISCWNSSHFSSRSARGSQHHTLLLPLGGGGGIICWSSAAFAAFYCPCSSNSCILASSSAIASLSAAIFSLSTTAASRE